MLRPTRLAFIIVTLLSCIPFTAAAQTPDTGTLAAGADIGVLFPDEALEKTISFDVYGEYYAAPRLSVRGMFNYASPGFENRTEDHFRQVNLLFNAVYNWEYGVWHPYVTAGAGAYFLREKLDGRDDPDSETRGGINFGGGLEYFLNRATTFKGEARWDVVSHPAGTPDATGFTISLGFKRYF
jgi:hypothetical protein